jgi:hypothetical protein
MQLVRRRFGSFSLGSGEVHPFAVPAINQCCNNKVGSKSGGWKPKEERYGVKKG